MVETLTQHHHVDSLVTSPTSVDEALHHGAVPSRWLFDEASQTMVPFEFSSDTGVKEGHVLCQFNLQGLLGVSILKRNGLECNADESLMEKNYHRDRSSVVQKVANDSVGIDDIETSWYAPHQVGNRCYRRTYCHPRGNGVHTTSEDHMDCN